MIPKIIHCCWLSGEPRPKLSEKCRESWRKFAPDWEIREWNLSNLSNISNLSNFSNFCLAAVAARKWAFAADWVRMAVLKEYGGVYFDFDFELVKPIDELPDGEWVAGQWLPDRRVGMEPAAIALEKGSPIAQAMLDYYAAHAFSDDKTVGEILEGLEIREQGLGIRVLDPEVMSPIGVDGKIRRTERTVGIHWYAMSWASPKRKIAKWLSWHGCRFVVDALLRMRRRIGKV